MNKKILISIIVLFIIILIFGVILVVVIKPKNNSNSGQNTAAPSFYSMSITEYEGTISGSAIINGSVTQLDEQGVADHALVSYNTPRDVLLVECSSGYALDKSTSPTSPSGNTITIDPILNAINMELVIGKQNIVSFVCTKSS
jgi:uncharacterized alpha/beta hydrolase family protein